jgi:tetratricopeptide (TPR) repeat protein
MELTIEQALQQGVTAHKEGKLQDAERLYRVILKSQPAHPDANHNLGVLAVSIHKLDTALLFFKAALEANPKIEQFWLSYIDALIKKKQFDNAKQVLEQAKKQGLGGERLSFLEAQLSSKIQIENVNTASPSQEQLSSLLEHYQNGRLSDAEKLSLEIIQEFPNYPFGWEVLGAVLGATGRGYEAVDAKQTVVALSPQDAEAHSNLGNTLKELGRLDEAEASYNRAISLNPDYAEVHSNLGSTLQELGRSDEAEASFNQAISLKPDLAISHYNLGNTLQSLGRLDEAEASYNRAISLKPDLAEAHGNLGITLQSLGRLDEATVSYNRAISLKPDLAEAHSNLGATLEKLGRSDEAEASYIQAIAVKIDYAEAHNNLGVILQKLGRLEESEASLKQAIALKSDYIVAHGNLGSTLRELGKYEEAILHYDLGSNPNAVAQSLECLYLNKNYSDFDKRLRSISELDDTNIRVAAVSAFAAHQMKKKDHYPFCTNPLDFLIIKNLSEYDSNSNELIDEIIKEADGYQLAWESRTTKFGFQGLNDVFKKPSKNIAYLESIALKAVDEYYDSFQFETSSFIKSWPKQGKLTGWYNRLLKNGYHVPHIHALGWLSGVIYLKTIDSVHNDEGAIEFGLHGYDLPIRDENYPRKLHQPKRGDIVLFPSSLFHRTIPFTKDVERCVIAFDLKPNLVKASKDVL